MSENESTQSLDTKFKHFEEPSDDRSGDPSGRADRGIRFLRGVALFGESTVYALTLLMGLWFMTAAADDETEASESSAPFVRAFTALPDGSWAGLFSDRNQINPVKYATLAPEEKIFKSAQYALS